MEGFWMEVFRGGEAFENSLNIPDPKPLPEESKPLPYMMVAKRTYRNPIPKLV